ncbi:ATP-binding cassette domain-containing protein [Planomonospora algeriensis]
MTAARTLSLAVGGWSPVVLVLAGAPWLLSEGAGPGVILGALAYVTQSLAPALDNLVEGLGVSGVRLWVSLDRIAEPARTGGGRPRGPEARLPAADGGIELRGVTFAYGPHAEPVIAGLDLSVPDGDHLTVVGPSGIGKSTLAALVAGVLRPDAGEVLVGGVPADRLDPAERVLIPQEAYVFRGSLMENLTYLARAGDGEADGAVDGAVAVLGLAGLVERLGGYRAEIRPALLSPSERQLVALVRAYLAPARLVVLDEATCHLDPAAEAARRRRSPAAAARSSSSPTGPPPLCAPGASSSWTACACGWGRTRSCSPRPPSTPASSAGGTPVAPTPRRRPAPGRTRPPGTRPDIAPDVQEPIR